MIVPPPLIELAAAELRLAASRLAPGRYAELWQRFGRCARGAIACDRMAEARATAPAALFRPAIEATEAPRGRRRGPTSARARQRQKIKQHNRQVTKRKERAGI